MLDSGRAAGPTYELPDADERQSRLSRLYRLVEYHRAAGRGIVVVQGLGGAGLGWCAAAARGRREDGSPRYFVVGLDLPRHASYQNVARVRAGTLSLPDASLAEDLRRAALDARSLTATVEDDALALADAVVVAVGDASADPLAVPSEHRSEQWNPRIEGLGPALHAVGRISRPDALVFLARPLSAPRAADALDVLSDARRVRGVESPPRVAWLAARDSKVSSPSERAVVGADETSAELSRRFLETLVRAPSE